MASAKKKHDSEVQQKLTELPDPDRPENVTNDNQNSEYIDPKSDDDVTETVNKLTVCQPVKRSLKIPIQQAET